MSKLGSIMMAMGIKKAAPAKTVAKEAAKVVSKPVAKAEAKAADAMEAQGRAMVKQYQKPEIKVVKMEKSNMRATSGSVPGPGAGNGGDVGGFDDFSAPDKGWGEVSTSIWD